ncbi:hypothetical protein HBB16_11480 [Pseudonocardia sp. MCCB 268]|nr:hypothetical protein [Pseudonocardia cytotoxica]
MEPVRSWPRAATWSDTRSSPTLLTFSRSAWLRAGGWVPDLPGPTRGSADDRGPACCRSRSSRRSHYYRSSTPPGAGQQAERDRVTAGDRGRGTSLPPSRVRWWGSDSASTCRYVIVVHNTALWFLSDPVLVGCGRVFAALVVSVAARLCIVLVDRGRRP